MNRKKFILIYLLVSFFAGLSLFFSLKKYSQHNFSTEKFFTLTDTVARVKDKTDNLCKYQILSEPKVGDQYIKINFWCQNQSKARSTLSLAAVPHTTAGEILKEYARIINFDFNLITQNKWYCLINDQELTETNLKQEVRPASTIDCFENKNLYRHDQKEL
ncbi:MAG: hypothetical protein KIH89_004385 [Candidatus Shapirobacteria bacterium]|nr:hypothetical protein [Candidatus Shapirobacteria bacterium]